ncbi:MAG: 16S rRNA (uracil(1498)-N(3))-methyltransferase [Gammaproteobacteria bacterium]|nr:16S rRNA (uracil(1498)-N(3))-methyltransferase [Gammaproteobacteria bacterium]
MRTTRIYLDTDLNLNTTVELDRQSSHHLTRVLRLRNKQQFTIFNGKNGEYTAELILDNKKTFASIIHHSNISTTPSISITLLQCISKSDRMDLAIQKATELGCSKIIPLISEHTSINLNDDRQHKKLSHWKSIIISACEQCGRNELPELSPVINLSELINTPLSGTKLVFDPLSDSSLHSIKPVDNNYFLLIGPEGGLSDNEVKLSRQAGFTGIKIGNRILRTETAAIAGISAIQSLWGEFKS